MTLLHPNPWQLGTDNFEPQPPPSYKWGDTEHAQCCREEVRKAGTLGASLELQEARVAAAVPQSLYALEP